MTIGQLALAAGVPVSTLRYYERRGLLAAAPRSAAGYRRYADEHVARVRFLRRAHELGFSRPELLAMVRLSDRRGVGSNEVKRVGQAKLAELDARIGDLVRVREALATLLGGHVFGPDVPCPIIAALAGAGPAAPRPRKRRA